MIFMHLDLPEDKLHIVLLQMPPVIKQKIPGLLPRQFVYVIVCSMAEANISRIQTGRPEAMPPAFRLELSFAYFTMF